MKKEGVKMEIKMPGKKKAGVKEMKKVMKVDKMMKDSCK